MEASLIIRTELSSLLFELTDETKVGTETQSSVCSHQFHEKMAATVKVESLAVEILNVLPK